jgi:hypothetical protein
MQSELKRRRADCGGIRGDERTGLQDLSTNGMAIASFPDTLWTCGSSAAGVQALACS